MFSGYFRSTDLRVVSVVSDDWDQSSSALFCFLRVVVSIRQCCLQCWQNLFLLLFLTHIVCQSHLWEVMPNAWLLVFLFSASFVEGLLWSTSRIVPSILRGWHPRYSSHLTRVLLYCFVSSSFLVPLRYYFLIFSFISSCLIVTASNIPMENCRFSFLRTFWFFLDLVVLFLPLCVVSPLFITSMAHFSTPNSIPISWLYILTVCIRVSNFILFLRQFDFVHVH